MMEKNIKTYKHFKTESLCYTSEINTTWYINYTLKFLLRAVREGSVLGLFLQLVNNSLLPLSTYIIFPLCMALCPNFPFS